MDFGPLSLKVKNLSVWTGYQKFPKDLVVELELLVYQDVTLIDLWLWIVQRYLSKLLFIKVVKMGKMKTNVFLFLIGLNLLKKGINHIQNNCLVLSIVCHLSPLTHKCSHWPKSYFPKYKSFWVAELRL